MPLLNRSPDRALRFSRSTIARRLVFDSLHRWRMHRSTRPIASSEYDRQMVDQSSLAGIVTLLELHAC